MSQDMISRWIPVSERLPESSQRVVVYAPGGSVSLFVKAVTSAPDATAGEFRHLGIKFWYPLPELPPLLKLPRKEHY